MRSSTSGWRGSTPAERPRDRLGRPLPWDGSAAQSFPQVPARSAITSAQALDEAAAYLADGLPFHAHEVLEQRWRCAPADEAPLWKALAQGAAGHTHLARGNPTGASRLRDRAESALRSYAGPRPNGVDDLVRSLGIGG